MAVNASRTITRTVRVNGVEHSYQCSVPVDLAGSEPLPVILAIHGKGDNGHDFLIGTNLGSAKAIVAAPTGQGLAWSPAPYAVSTVEEDTALLNALIDDIVSTYPVNPERIYLAGFSNGGGFVTVLANNNPDAYAGVATVSGAIRVDLDDVARGEPIDYLNIHGTWDDVVPYEGQERGHLGVILPARDVVAAFHKRNGEQATTEHIAVQGMSHEWPAGVWAQSRGIDVTEKILEFFGIDSLASDGH